MLTDHVMYDLWPMVAQLSHRLKYVNLLLVLQSLPDTADSDVQATLPNAIAMTTGNDSAK